MSYNPAIPQSTDKPANSQAQILNNFNQLNVQFAVDHVAFDALSGNGQHKKVTLTDVAVDPTLAYPESQINSKTFGGAGGGTPPITQELYYTTTSSLTGLDDLVRLIPSIKAMGKIQENVAPNAPTLITSNTLNLNVNPTITRAGDVNTISFIDPLPYSTYFFLVDARYATIPRLSAPFTGPFTTTGFSYTQITNSTQVLGFIII